MSVNLQFESSDSDEEGKEGKEHKVILMLLSCCTLIDEVVHMFNIVLSSVVTTFYFLPVRKSLDNDLIHLFHFFEF